MILDWFRSLDIFKVNRNILLCKKERTRLNYTACKLNKVERSDDLSNKEPSWDGGTKGCMNGPGHMTTMAATLLYSLPLQNQKSDDLETWLEALMT